MKLPEYTLSANGNTPWISVNPWLINGATVGLALTFSPDANLTASVQYTYDDPMQTPKAVTLARSGTSLTVTLAGHGLNTGDNVILSNPNGDANNIWGSGNPGTSYDVASVTDDNNFVVTVANTGAAAAGGSVQTFRVFTHPTLGNQVGAPPTRIDGGFSWQIGAFRLKVSGYTAGTATLTGQQGKGY